MVDGHLTGAHKINSYFSWEINTYLSVANKTCLYIYMHVYMYILKESERDIDQLIQFDISFFI